MNGWTQGCMYVYKVESIYRCMCGWMYGCMKIWMMNGLINVRDNGWT